MARERGTRFSGSPCEVPDRALLIGIDHYAPDPTEAGPTYPCLEGSVRDVDEMERLLVDTWGLPEGRVHKLTAPRRDAELSHRRSRGELPTYENMIAAFHRLLDEARPRDRILIHYSGHGGRARTHFPKVKGEHGWDEVLVPTDVGEPSARYLRDVELAYLMRKMVARELLVTLVLDCCHAGGAVRSGRRHWRRAAVRGVGQIDTRPRPRESLVAALDGRLEATWRELTAWNARSIEVASGWLPEPRGFVLLAACRAHEPAFEHAFDGRHKHGVLTYRLLEALKRFGTGLTYKRLFDRVTARIRGDFDDQTPQLEGEADRFLFSDRCGAFTDAVNVLRTDPVTRRLLLHTGRAHGVAAGDRFVVYPLGTEPVDSDSDPPLIVEVDDLGATESWAAVVGGRLEAEAETLEPGSQAILVEPDLLRTVRLDEGRPELAAVAEALRQRASGFVETRSSGPTDLAVVINGREEYEILGADGAALPHQLPLLEAGSPDAASRIAARLVHLAKFLNISELDNPETSTLSGALELELRPLSGGDSVVTSRARASEGGVELAVGDGLCLTVRNTSEQPVHVCVFGLQPDWSVVQLHPAGRGDSVVVEAGGAETIRRRAALPPDIDSGVDVVKVFATAEANDMHWLELPTLEGGSPRASTEHRGFPKTRFEQLLATLIADAPRLRLLEPGNAEEWTTEHLKVRIVRR